MKLKIFLVFLISLVVSFLLDKKIICFLISLRSQILDKLIVYSNYLGNVVMVSVILIVFFYIKKQRKIIIPFLFTIAFASGVAQLIKFVTHIPRPYLGLELPRLVTEAGYSFPSGHAMALSIGYVFLKESDSRFAVYWLIISVFLLFGRVYTGIHYLSDIIGGIIVGYFTSCFFISQLIKKEK